MFTAALITQLSSLTLDPAGLSSSLHQLYVSCHCYPLLSSPGQGATAQKARSVIKTEGHQGPSKGPESRRWSGAQLGVTRTVLSATSLTPEGMHRDPANTGERDLQGLALHSRSGDISFVFVPIWDPAPRFCTRGGTKTQTMGIPCPRWELERSSCSTIRPGRPKSCLMWPMTSLKP